MDQKLEVNEGGADAVEPVEVAPDSLEPAGDSRDDELEDPELDAIESLAGTTFDNRYQIEAELARGGMGVVFKAQHLSLNRPVVIKVLKAAQTEGSSAKARFEREARRACQLDHPHLVTVHDFGYHGDLGYLVMEFVPGITLYDYIKRYGRLSFAQFAPVAAALCSGLGEAHRQGIVHRDIKESNVMLSVDGGHLRRVKILDFGLAKAEGSAEDEVTRQSALMGTIGAMAPERILCKPTDCRVDLYALGVTCYRMISGRRPFVGDDMHVLYQHVHEHPAPLTELLPPDHDYPLIVLEWVHRLLAKDPEDRPRNGSEAREWLFETVADSSVFRMDEGLVNWMELSSGDFPISGTREVTDPSWSLASSPGASYRSVLPASGDRLGQEQTVAASAQRPTWTQEAGASAAPAGPRNRLPVALGIGAVGIFAAGAFGVSVMLASRSAAPVATEVPVPVVAAPVTAAPATGEDIEQVFARVESDLARGAYATAENLLNSVSSQLASRTEYQVRAAEYQAQIDIDKNLRRAQLAESKLQIEEACRLYDSVLSLDAGNQRARERLEVLTSQVVLKVSSDPAGAEVLVDDARVGTTPFEQLMPARFSTVQVRRPGFRDWSTSLVPDGGVRIELAAELDKKGSRPRTPTADEKSPRPTGDGPLGIKNENLMGMD